MCKDLLSGSSSQKTLHKMKRKSKDWHYSTGHPATKLQLIQLRSSWPGRVAFSQVTFLPFSTSFCPKICPTMEAQSSGSTCTIPLGNISFGWKGKNNNEQNHKPYVLKSGTFNTEIDAAKLLMQDVKLWTLRRKERNDHNRHCRKFLYRKEKPGTNTLLYKARRRWRTWINYVVHKIHFCKSKKQSCRDGWGLLQIPNFRLEHRNLSY